MTVTVDPIWPWSQLLTGESSGGSVLGWMLSHSLSLLLVAVPLALILVTSWTYFRSGAPRRRVFVVLGLRLLAFLLAAAAIMRPSLGLADRNAPRGLLLVVVDSSESMTILDEIDSQSRWAYLQKLLKDSGTSIEDLQDQQNVDVEVYRFAGETTRTQLEDLGNPDGKRTDIGSMLKYLHEHRDNRRLLGLLVLSDGADNGTRVPALPEAVRWRNLPCPIHTFAFGNPGTSDRTRDIAMTGITTQPVPVPIKALLTVRVTIDAPGFVNTGVGLKMFIDDKEVKDFKPTTATLPLTRGNVVALTTNAPEKAGEIKLTVRVGDRDNCKPFPDEAITTNNEISTYVTVTKEGLRVLLVDKARDGEPQSISDALVRDKRIRVTTVWLRGDEHADPDTAALLDCDKNPYDVIILGDVTARQMNAANPVALKHINKHVVEKGAGLLMIGGYNSFGNGDWKTPDGKDIADLLPLDLTVSGQVPEGQEVRMLPTEPGKRLFGYMLRLTDGDEASQVKAWADLNQRPLEGMAVMGKPRNERCVILARENDAKTGRPLLVAQTLGDGGRVLAFGGDTTYRWKRNAETQAMQRRFWQRLVLWLAKQDETQGSVWVLPDARRMPAHNDLGFSVGMKSKTGAAITNGTYKVEVVGPDGQRWPMTTAYRDGDQRGTFTRADAAGEYHIEVSGEGKDEKGDVVQDRASVRFLVYDEDVEMQHRAADHQFLEKLAGAGGGKPHRADELPGFLRELQNQPDAGLRQKLNLYPDWRTTGSSPFLGFFLLLFVAVVSIEWLLRRRWGMV